MFSPSHSQVRMLGPTISLPASRAGLGYWSSNKFPVQWMYKFSSNCVHILPYRVGPCYWSSCFQMNFHFSACWCFVAFSKKDFVKGWPWLLILCDLISLCKCVNVEGLLYCNSLLINVWVWNLIWTFSGVPHITCWPLTSFKVVLSFSEHLREDIKYYFADFVCKGGRGVPPKSVTLFLT